MKSIQSEAQTAGDLQEVRGQDTRTDGTVTRIQRLAPLVTAVAGLGLLTNVLGYLREIALASLYGSSAITDAFFAAAYVPNTLSTILATGAGAAILVPVLVGRRERSPAEASQLALSLVNISLVVLVLLTLALSVTSRFWVRLLFPGFAPATANLAIHLAYVLNPVVLFLTLAAILTGVLNTFGHFRSAVLAPCVGNLVVIVLIGVSTLLGGIQGAAVGVLAGAVVQLAILSWMVFSRDLAYRPHLGLRDPGLRSFAEMAGPAMLYLAVAYVSLTAERVFASGYGPGGVSTLSYAMRLFTLPASIVAGSLATVLHPRFSALASRGESEKLRECFHRGFDLTILALVPVAIAALVFSHSIVEVAYGHGRFSHGNVTLTAATFAAYSLGILPLAVTILCQRLFYALRTPQVPLVIECAALALYVAIAPGLGHLLHVRGLALARAGSFLLVGALSLVFALRKLNGPAHHASPMAHVFRCGVAALPTTLLWLAVAAQLRVEMSTWAHLVGLVLSGSLGLALYLYLARTLRCRGAEGAMREVVDRFTGATLWIRRVARVAS